MKNYLFIIVLMTSCEPLSASAAMFSVLCDNSIEISARACTIKLSGQIEAGDHNRLRSVLKQPLPEGWHYGVLLLDSPGGSVIAALEVAAVVRQALLDTATHRWPRNHVIGTPEKVQYRWKCVSACFLIWVAGADRSSLFITPSQRGGTSDIGLHRPYLGRSAYEATPEKVAAAQQQAMQISAEYLKRENIPQVLIEKMLQRASTQIYWLTPEDADIAGRAPWFEEMMIARCGYDPTYVREITEWSSKRDIELIVEKRKTIPVDLEPKYQKYLTWRQKYNACEYQARISAQLGFHQ